MWCERSFPCGYDGAAGCLSGRLSNQPERSGGIFTKNLNVGSKYLFAAIPDRMSFLVFGFLFY